MGLVLWPILWLRGGTYVAMGVDEECVGSRGFFYGGGGGKGLGLFRFLPTRYQVSWDYELRDFFLQNGCPFLGASLLGPVPSRGHERLLLHTSFLRPARGRPMVSVKPRPFAGWAFRSRCVSVVCYQRYGSCLLEPSEQTTAPRNHRVENLENVKRRLFHVVLYVRAR